jgi:hypothetical protein
MPGLTSRTGTILLTGLADALGLTDGLGRGLSAWKSAAAGGAALHARGRGGSWRRASALAKVRAHAVHKAKEVHAPHLPSRIPRANAQRIKGQAVKATHRSAPPQYGQ